MGEWFQEQRVIRVSSQESIIVVLRLTHSHSITVLLAIEAANTSTVYAIGQGPAAF